MKRPMALWLADAPLILASKSKTRWILLNAAGVPVETAAAPWGGEGTGEGELPSATAVTVLSPNPGLREALRMSMFLLAGPPPPLPPELWQATQDVSL